MSNVIQFPTKGGRNKKCPVCGNEWWIVEAVVMAEDDLHIGGFAGEPVCHTCFFKHEVEQ